MPGAWAESQSLLAAGLSFEEMARLELLTVYGEESVTEVSFVKDVKTLEALNKEFEALKQRAEVRGVWGVGVECASRGRR